MPFTLLYHPSIAEEDLPSLPGNIRRRIAQAIETRLGQAPDQHGLPLRGTLKGYWKLRVGAYRVVYKIVETEVRILGVRHRKEIYKDILQGQLSFRPRYISGLRSHGQPFRLQDPVPFESSHLQSYCPPAGWHGMELSARSQQVVQVSRRDAYCGRAGASEQDRVSQPANPL